MFKMYFKVAKNTWRLFLLISVLSVILAIPKFTWAQQTSNSLICSGDLSTSLLSIIKGSQLTRARLGISLQTLKDGHSLLDLDSSSYFIPASNAKLLTTAAALQSLDSDFTFSTSFLSNGSNLIVLGTGDPSLISDQLNDIAQELKEKGLQKEVEHLQVLTDHDNSLNSFWEWGDLVLDYGAFPASVNLNQNSFSLTLTPTQIGKVVKLDVSDLTAAKLWQINNLIQTGNQDSAINVVPRLGNNNLDLIGSIGINSQPVSLNLSIPDPEQYFLDSFSKALEKIGIKVKNKEKTTSLDGDYSKLVEIKSKPLSELIKIVNQDSNNLYAESLLKVINAYFKESNNTEVIKKALTKIGVDPGSFKLVDGSGISRQNLVSPEALVQTLRAMNKSEYAKIYRDSLAVAGESGTLINRFKNTPVQGNLQAKTGTMTGVSSLSGYLYPTHYQPLVLSIIINNSLLPSAYLRQVIDEIVLLFNQLKPC